MDNPLYEEFKDIPLQSISPVEMTEPNMPIQIYSGGFTIKNDTKEFELKGEIAFKWFPYMEVKIKGFFAKNVKINLDYLEDFDIMVKGQISGRIKITGINIEDNPSCEGEWQKFIWGESNIPVNEVSFSIPNMREFLGDSIKEETVTGIRLSKARLILDDNPYKIVIDKLPDYQDRMSRLKNNGGYFILYAGRITKQKGSFSLLELHTWHDRFHHFLYFLNGRRVAPMFYTGVHEGLNIWTDYSSYTVDMHKSVPCWSDIIYLNDLPHLWRSYNNLWKTDLDKDFLKTAIHWYIEANSNAGMIEGSIILIQTALELVYNWLIVENQRLIVGNDADSMSAANKIRLLIFQFKISSAIPTAFKELAKIDNVEDGPEVFVKIRNALVHGQQTKRAELMKINLLAKYQALQLGIWYVELALLYILKYNGKYKNRTDGNSWRDTGESVPWVANEDNL